VGKILIKVKKFELEERMKDMIVYNIESFLFIV